MHTMTSTAAPPASGKPLHLAFLTPEYVSEPKFDGGLANYLHRVTKALRQAGHRPEVFVISDRDESTVHDDIPVHRVRYPFDRWTLFLYRTSRVLLWTRLNLTFEVLRATRALAKRLTARHSEDPFDLVQGSDFFATGLSVPLRADLPVVTRLSYYAPAWRQTYELPLTRDRWFKERLEVRALRRSVACYAPSRRIATLVREKEGVDVQVIHPPAYLETPVASEDHSVYEEKLAGRRYVLFFGRQCRLKGAFVFARAAALLAPRFADLDFVLAGREDPAGIVDELRRIMGEHGRRLIHLERLPHAQLYPVVRHASVVALPSLIDNFPNTCIEAMSLGQIVVGSRGGGFDDLIQEGTSGLLANVDDPHDLADKIAHVLDMQVDERHDMRRAAQDRIAEFSPEVTIPQLLRFYQECIERQSPSRARMSASA